ncbi:MAG: hypothetical protein K5931_09300 [Lachnospiraceae bacterium]|nr:hypothetical protein [Lachnospiraceae bacterium]
MKFKNHVSPELQVFLENEYKEYVKKTPLTKDERKALREWVKEGYSVYENSRGAWYDGQVPVEFIEVYRDEKYIREHTQGMSPEEARKLALAYYGWDDEPDDNNISSSEIFDEEILKNPVPFK